MSTTVPDIVERTSSMAARAKEGTPLTNTELDEVLRSIQNVNPESLDYGALRSLLQQIAHISHKNWARTKTNAERLGEVLMPAGLSPGTREMLDRVLKEGNWDGAAKHAASPIAGEKPWAVLVTGCNGIRKTTSMYQPWFSDLLAEALYPPKEMKAHLDTNMLPCGENSFFRQLDHMIATLCNEDFSILYKLTGAEMNGEQEPTKELIQKYSNLKAAIFSRYRTLSELLGVLLLREAQKDNLNCLMETSGRDVAMFHYVDHFFAPENYNKLALHFTINDLSFAQKSVDSRMVREMLDGVKALDESIINVIYSNAGGPYGSEVLPAVQEASEKVWNEIILENDGVGADWYKATIVINAHSTEPWTAQAVRPDGTLGTKYTFERR